MIHAEECRTYNPKQDVPHSEAGEGQKARILVFDLTSGHSRQIDPAVARRQYHLQEMGITVSKILFIMINRNISKAYIVRSK